jgi:hypothetical protein
MLVKGNRKCTWYGEEITETQYNEILSMLRSRPTAPEGFGYRLTPALAWELYALPPVEETEPTEEEYAEAGKILLGVSQ